MHCFSIHSDKDGKKSLTFESMSKGVSETYLNTLREHALQEGTKSVELFKRYEQGEKMATETNEAGLIFPIGLFDKMLYNTGFVTEGYGEQTMHSLIYRDASKSTGLYSYQL